MWFNILMVIFSGILAGSTAFYVFMTRKLWLATKDTAERTRDAFRLSLAMQLYQIMGFALGEGRRRDRIFFNTLKEIFPGEFDCLSSMMPQFLKTELVNNNWGNWRFTHDEELARGVEKTEWHFENTEDLTIGTLPRIYEAGNYGVFTYQCPEDKEIAWIEFAYNLKYAHEYCNAALEYELPGDPEQWHETWKWGLTDERDAQQRINFDDGATKLRFTFRWIRREKAIADWHFRAYRIVICLLPKTQK